MERQSCQKALKTTRGMAAEGKESESANETGGRLRYLTQKRRPRLWPLPFTKGAHSSIRFSMNSGAKRSLPGRYSVDDSNAGI